MRRAVSPDQRFPAKNYSFIKIEEYKAVQAAVTHTSLSVAVGNGNHGKLCQAAWAGLSEENVLAVLARRLCYCLWGKAKAP